MEGRKDKIDCPHKDKPIQARGACKNCYEKWLRQTNPSYYERQKLNRKKWAENNKEKIDQTHQKWIFNNKEEIAKRRRGHYLKKKFGITVEEYIQMFNLQDGNCAMGRISKKLTENGKKLDNDKLRYDLIPILPMMEVAKVFTIGANKYGDRNFEKGIKWGRIVGAINRHFSKWWAGEIYDQEDGQHHLSSVIWGALVLMEYERTHPELDDRTLLNKPLLIKKQIIEGIKPEEPKAPEVERWTEGKKDDYCGA